jgi:hypothetical protein
MQSLFETYKLKDFIIKKPRKNEDRIRLIDKLSEILGRNKKGMHFTTLIWTNSMLEDSIRACENFSDIKARNWHFNEYKNSTKVIHS